MSNKMFPIIAVVGVAAVALMASKKKKPAGTDSKGGEATPKPDSSEQEKDEEETEGEFFTLEEQCDQRKGVLMIVKDSSGAPSKVCQSNGKLYMMPLDEKGNLVAASALGDLAQYPEALNKGLWDGATSKQFGDFGWSADIVDGHREVLDFVVKKLGHEDIEAFQIAWNNKNNGTLRKDGVLDFKTLEAINKSK